MSGSIPEKSATVPTNSSPSVWRKERKRDKVEYRDIPTGGYVSCAYRLGRPSSCVTDRRDWHPGRWPASPERIRLPISQQTILAIGSHNKIHLEWRQSQTIHLVLSRTERKISNQKRKEKKFLFWRAQMRSIRDANDNAEGSKRGEKFCSVELFSNA